MLNGGQFSAQHASSTILRRQRRDFHFSWDMQGFASPATDLYRHAQYLFKYPLMNSCWSGVCLVGHIRHRNLPLWQARCISIATLSANELVSAFRGSVAEICVFVWVRLFCLYSTGLVTRYRYKCTDVKSRKVRNFQVVVVLVIKGRFLTLE